MSKKLLIDTNVIVRFLVEDNKGHFIKAVKIFEAIEEQKTEAFLLDFIVAEVVYVLKRVYKLEKKDIANAMQQLLMYENLYTENKLITYEALSIYASKNIDFADAYLCAKAKLESFEIVSFDKDLTKCL